jgi:hypothetical protein
MTKRQQSFMRQFAKARKEMRSLRKAFPELFNKQGRPVVAVLSLPRMQK